MRASIIIPVWNGADVLPGCLDAIQEQAGNDLFEIICVDNASEDFSATLIAQGYPGVRLLRQPVNLGFAGGVNAGIDAARGGVLVLLNQDCIVQPGWLAALGRALDAHPDLGVAGCTISRPDGTVDHVGAEIRRPDGHGLHLAQTADGQLQEADFVTGAAMAIPRRALEAIGSFDEGFYPGYYEDADYCYRARRRGFSVACAAEARVIHLARSKAWTEDTIKYHADHNLARYRFVAKHFDSQETEEFFVAELRNVAEEEYFDRAIGRAIAARDLLRGLPDVLQRRGLDLAEPVSPAHRRHLQVGFARIWRQGQAAAGQLLRIDLIPLPLQERQAGMHHPPETPAEEGATYEEEMRRLKQREYEILRRLYPLGFSPGGRQARLKQVGYRLGSLWRSLTGTNEVLQGELQAVRRALYLSHKEELTRRLKLIETLLDYDYR